jgi:hypothetical protein
LKSLLAESVDAPQVAIVEDFGARLGLLVEEYLLGAGFLPSLAVPRFAWQLAMFLGSRELRGLPLDSLVRLQSLQLLATLARTSVTDARGSSKILLLTEPNSTTVRSGSN